METSYTIREPKLEDSKEIFNLIKESKTLDLNSQYLYMLLATHFKNSCAVALFQDKIVALVLAYYLPEDDETLFIWQVATSNEHRGKNLALKLIENIASRKNINRLISTVSPSNLASTRVFEKFAQSVNSNIEKSVLFSKEDFINAHEDEILYTIKINKEKE